MKYLAKKLAGFVMTMLVVSFLVFAAFAVIPGEPATAMLGTQATPEKLAALREQMGLNEPLLVRFGSWAVNFIQGDFGTSYKYQMSVRSMIAEKIPVTLTLTAMSFLIMVAVSIPVGLFCAHHAGGKVDPDRRSGDHGDSTVLFGHPDHASVWSCAAFVYTGRVCVLYDERHRLSGIPDLSVGRDCAAESGDGDQAAAHIRTV